MFRACQSPSQAAGQDLRTPRFSSGRPRRPVNDPWREVEKKKGARNKCPLTRFCLRELGVRITKKLSREARRDLEITSATRWSYVHLRSELEEKLKAEAKTDGQPTKQCDQRHRACCLRQFFGYRDRGGRDRRSGLDDRAYFHFFLVGGDGDDWKRP